jgi:hypothetical protein
MDYTHILSNADRLRQNSSFKIYITDTVKDILYIINTNIINSNSLGISKIEYKLPINFKLNNPNITNTEIQTIIYYKIISELERLHYSISMKFYNNYTLLLIEWTQKTTESELTKMQSKILSLSKT